jgi:hypothetical protein
VFPPATGRILAGLVAEAIAGRDARTVSVPDGTDGPAQRRLTHLEYDAGVNTRCFGFQSHSGQQAVSRTGIDIDRCTGHVGHRGRPPGFNRDGGARGDGGAAHHHDPGREP